MKKQTVLWLLAAPALLLAQISYGALLAAQQPPTPNQTPQQTPQPSQPPDQRAQPAPGDQAQAQPDQVFHGTIVKSGDKYVLQDASGKSYDMDHQELAQKYEGKQVRVKGVLDPDGKTIHIR